MARRQIKQLLMVNKLVEIIDTQAARYGEREAYRFCWRKDGEWLPTSWTELAAQVHVAARALASLGLREKDTVAICSPNTPQILITEFGAFENRVAVIPIYSASSQAQFDFIVGNGEARVLFVGDSHQYPLAYNYWKTNPRAVSRIVVFKNDGFELPADDTVTIFWDDFVRLGMEAGDDVRRLVEQRRRNGLPEDMATLIYTSGTTGEPKGVVITHSNYDAAISAHLVALESVSDKDLSMAFLPMSHILEKAWCFFCIFRGIRIAINYDPRVIADTIHTVHPNVMCCVPRFWEKVYAGVKEKIAGMPKIQRRMVSRALKTGRRRNLDYVRLGAKPPYFLEKEYRFWDRRVFSKIKHTIGIPNPNIFPTAGAPLSDRICEFMRSIGIEVTIGYGLSETTATVSFFRPGRPRAHRASQRPLQDRQRQVHSPADARKPTGRKQVHRRGGSNRRPAQIRHRPDCPQPLATAPLGRETRNRRRRHRDALRRPADRGLHHAAGGLRAERRGRVRKNQAHNAFATPLLNNERRGDEYHEGAPSRGGPPLCRRH